MKKLVFLFSLTLTLFFVSCTESKVRNTATEHIKKQMKDPSSFKAENVDVILDTVPVFLKKEILATAKVTLGYVNDVDRYSKRSNLWAKEKSDAQSSAVASMFLLKAMIDSENKKEKEDSDIQYFVLMNVSGKNSYGGVVSSKYIVIVNKDKTDEVLGEYRVDEDLYGCIYTILSVDGKSSRIKTNSFGKTEREGLNKIEQFVFCDD